MPMSSNLSIRFLKKASLARPWATRNVHTRRSLLYPLEDGLGKFMPPAALKTAVEWQEGLLERLNEEVKGTPEENTTIAQTVINTSALKERSLAFNYASLALNNSYFLDQLKPSRSGDGGHEHEMSLELASAIEEHHGSLRQLKSSFSAAALGMFSSGWVWFVTDSRGVTGILPTYGPGTLLVRSRKYIANHKGLHLGDAFLTAASSSTTIPPSSPFSRETPPGVAPTSPTSGMSSASSPSTPRGLNPSFMHTSATNLLNWRASQVPSIHGAAAQDVTPQSFPTILNVGETVFPLFCLPVYEHNWMSAGFGVWGKEEWLKHFWSVVDWEKVSKSYKAARDTRKLVSDGFP